MLQKTSYVANSLFSHFHTITKKSERRMIFCSSVSNLNRDGIHLAINVVLFLLIQFYLATLQVLPVARQSLERTQN